MGRSMGWARYPAKGWARASVTSAVIVLALPRGGVPVAVPIARRLAAPLGLMMVRKLGVPGRPELAMGAHRPDRAARRAGPHERVIADAGVDEAAFERVRRREEAVLADRAGALRRASPWLLRRPPDAPSCWSTTGSRPG